jgi:GTP-binding protein LepA
MRGNVPAPLHGDTKAANELPHSKTVVHVSRIMSLPAPPTCRGDLAGYIPLLRVARDLPMVFTLRSRRASLLMAAPEFIRNFAIIAHIDHGKSTLADRLLLHTHTIEERKFQDQVLDAMDLERERGITIKSHPVRMEYTAANGQVYQLNLIDTPGHVDFAYEVSRSLAACDGGLLVIDAVQGVQAQTVANYNLAVRQKLAIIPLINKIDLPAADIDMCTEQMEEILTIPADEALLVSAKMDIGINELLEAVITRVPPPNVPADGVLRALVFDSVYDTYRGVVSYIRVVSGNLKKGDKVKLLSNGQETEVKDLGFFRPAMTAVEFLGPGEVGFIVTTIRSPADILIGDTLTTVMAPCPVALPGFQRIHPMVFSGIYPCDTRDYEQLKYSLAKFQLNDSALQVQSENSPALGAGFRCGFLGLLHMEIVQERLHREYDMEVIMTYPSVIYHVYLTDGKMIAIDNPMHLPDPTAIGHIEEPIIIARIISPSQYLGAILNMVKEKRGEDIETATVDHLHIMITTKLPLHEIVVDFYDRLKTITRGYGSMDYEPSGYRSGPLVKLEMLVNGDPIDAFSCIVHRDCAEFRGRRLAERLRDVIPQHMFQIAIQAAIGGKVVARETVRAMRKDVLSKCYGGDITRKRKLLEKQKEGKKKMKEFGNVTIPQSAFVEILKTKQE